MQQQLPEAANLVIHEEIPGIPPTGMTNIAKLIISSPGNATWKQAWWTLPTVQLEAVCALKCEVK